MTKSGLVTHPLIDDWVSFKLPGQVQLRIGKVEFGQGIGTAIARIAAEELDVDPVRIDIIAGDTHLTPNEGFTAGSMSIELCGASVRGAASAARRLLASAATVPPEAIVDGSFMIGGTCNGETYWTIAPKIDLRLPIADWESPKSANHYRLIGTDGGGIDLRAALMGAAYIHDMTWPGLLHARVVRNADFTARLGKIGHLVLPPAVQLVHDGAFVGIIAPREDQAVLFAQRIAERVEWLVADETRPDPLRQLVQAAALDQMYNGEEVGGSGHRLTVVASRDFIAHASISPSCSIAIWEDDHLTVWSHSQGVFSLREALAALFGIEETRIRVIHARSSGCYGHNGADDAAADAAMLARTVPGQPVRLLWTRAQELTCPPLGPAMRTRIVAHLDDVGMMKSMHAQIVSGSHGRRPGSAGINLLAGYLREDRVTQDMITDPPSAVGGGADRNALTGYAIEDISATKEIVTSPQLRTSSLRSLGAHVNITAIESMMDEAAAVADMDPIAYRLLHLTDPRCRAVIERVAKMASWPRANCGIGYAQYKNKAAYCAVIARIELAEQVQVTQVWCAVDAGLAIDPDGIINQIEGGIIQSISWTLKESAPLANGVPVAENWDDYPILCFDEIPEVSVELIDCPDEPSLGVGEASVGPAAAAVTNAIAATVGVRVASMPITRDKIVGTLIGEG